MNGAKNGAWQLAIPPEAKNVFQAVALNEHRYLLPGESIGRGVQKGFIGSHADIGGSYGTGDLSDMALNWMVKQAMNAGVKMGDSDVLHTIIADPVIHDKSGSILTGAPAPNAEDRLVQYRDSMRTRQLGMPFSSGMTWADTQQYIEYLSENDPRRPSFMAGTVDMRGYLDWLSKNGYGIDMRVN